MTWEQWYMVENFDNVNKVLFNWAFFICAGIASKIFADWITREGRFKEDKHVTTKRQNAA